MITVTWKDFLDTETETYNNVSEMKKKLHCSFFNQVAKIIPKHGKVIISDHDWPMDIIIKSE